MCTTITVHYCGYIPQPFMPSLISVPVAAALLLCCFCLVQHYSDLSTSYWILNALQFYHVDLIKKPQPRPFARLRAQMLSWVEETEGHTVLHVFNCISIQHPAKAPESDRGEELRKQTCRAHPKPRRLHLFPHVCYSWISTQ